MLAGPADEVSVETGLTKRPRHLVRVERHPLGARLHVAGFRVHEWHLGTAILLGLAAGLVFGRVDDSVTATLAACAGIWLVAKDWHDLLPSRRDTAAWKLGFHRRPNPLRTFRRADPLPMLAALGAIAVAIINLVSALTPNVGWRGHALLQLEPLSAMRVSHALAIPVAWVLLVAGIYLGRRRRRALQLAIVLLLILAALNILKGLDVEEAAADVLAAALLWLGRGSFCVEHEPLARGRDAIVRVGGLAIGSVLVAATAVWIGAPQHTSIGTVLRATGDLLSWQHAPIAFRDELGQLGLTVGILGVMALFACASILFRPLGGPRLLPDPATRALAVALVRKHGSDTLAYFKLRRDKHYLFSPDRSAFVGYRIENGVLLLSGDPVGPDSALPALMRELSDFAERRALTIAALGVSERLRPLFEQLGLRSLYIGDEAIVDTGAFSLEGRAIRKVRQSVSRLEKAGFAVELREVSTLDEATLDELRRVSDEWRRGEPERGFSMTLDELCCADQADTLVVIGRDSGGLVRAFLQFVPSYGRPAMSLSAMRRERTTPNGMTEFLLVRSIELLRERGVEEVSLNFAAFARIVHAPSGIAQRVARRLILFGDRFFQIESLYRFNAKFFPRWEPRYFMFDGFRNLPRAALGAARAEGQLPTPALLLQRRHEDETFSPVPQRG
jgi:lysyl-tRNA synthetase, class II